MPLTWNRTVSWSSDGWRQRSACRSVDPNLFFPTGSANHGAESSEVAKQVCSDCAVTAECLDFALRANLEAGVWGGTSEDERRRLRRQWLTARRKTAKANRAS